MTVSRPKSAKKPASRSNATTSKSSPAASRAALSADRIERIAEFASARFVKSVADASECPPESGAEIAFVGRSNAGKSSSINKFVGQTKLAYASKMPGRTRELNFFALRGGGYLVDLPGYGFARTPRDKQRVWIGVIETYLRTRAALRGIVLLSDVRHAPSELDLEFIEWLNGIGDTAMPRPPILWLLNKADKLTQSERMKVERETRAHVQSALRDDDQVLLFSAHTGLGMNRCASIFSAWLSSAKSVSNETNNTD